MNLQMAETISTELRIFRVLPKLGSTNLEDYLRLNLKECECRFNHRNEDLFALPIKINELYDGYKIKFRKSPYIPAWECNFYCTTD